VDILAAGDVLIVRLATGGSFQPAGSTEYVITTLEDSGSGAECGHYDGANQMYNYFDGNAGTTAWMTTANMKIMINNSLYFRFQTGNATNNCISGMQIK
jgi:hypothetical protein|tara:strand:- start:57 stop:353 length:297 start_codon:yes stop_codon:yes gene_type:complete